MVLLLLSLSSLRRRCRRRRPLETDPLPKRLASIRTTFALLRLVLASSLGPAHRYLVVVAWMDPREKFVVASTRRGDTVNT